MARKAYKVQDLAGRAWLVQPGDPAFDLCVTLKRKDIVLTSDTLRWGSIDQGVLDQAEKAIRAYGKLGNDVVEDPYLSAQLMRYTTLRSCLRALLGDTIQAPTPPDSPVESVS